MLLKSLKAILKDIIPQFLFKTTITLLHAKGLTLHLVYMLIPLLSGIDRAYHGKILTKLADLADKGKIRPLIERKIFSFSEVAAAHTYLESGQAIGKVVLDRSFEDI